MQLVDTHCHIHSPEFFAAQEAEGAYKRALKSGVQKMVCVGTSVEDSEQALSFARKHAGHSWASVGIHPHDATEDETLFKRLSRFLPDENVVAIGECGLDFYYNDRTACLAGQEKTLRFQIELALTYDLPLIFHVREAFTDFWPIFDSYRGLRGVLHSFTDRPEHLEKGLERGLLIGVNGIATFTTHAWQRDLFKSIPLTSLLLETDSPFLTPVPKRGKINEPENVIYITKYVAELRKESEEAIVHATTRNAEKLFRFS